MRQITPEKRALSETLNNRPEIRDFMRTAMTLSPERQRFITEVLTVCNSRGIRPDEAWNSICRGYGIPTTYELDRSSPN